MRCTVCREVVETYVPTGTTMVRAIRHPIESYPAGGPPCCAGSFTAPMNEAEHERDIDRTQRWAASHHFTDSQPGG